MSTSIPIFPEFNAQVEIFTQWKDRLENHLDLQNVVHDSKRKQAILAFVGADGFSRLTDRVRPEREVKDVQYADIVNILTTIYEQKKNKWSARSQFRKLRQFTGESLSDYENRLRHASIECQFSTDQLQERLIEQFIEGMENKSIVQNILMRGEGDSSFKTLAEVSAIAASVMSAQSAATIIRGPLVEWTSTKSTK